MGFLTRYDEELMEPLVQCQVSQVSMRVARGARHGSRVMVGESRKSLQIVIAAMKLKDAYFVE